MKSVLQPQPVTWPAMAWLSAAFAGFFAPAGIMLWIADSPAPAQFSAVGGPILAVGLMGAGMIAAAISGRLWVGVLFSLLAGVGLILLAYALGMLSLPYPAYTALAFFVASISFAARGVLFARSGLSKGWWIAVFVVAGEAAILATALAKPGALPDWLLVLLPAQWANMAIEASLTGVGVEAAKAALIALAGTAAATLVVARLWSRRWPYALMFSAWLGFSALVWNAAY